MVFRANQDNWLNIRQNPTLFISSETLVTNRSKEIQPYYLISLKHVQIR
jgi:hypothetical protein